MRHTSDIKVLYVSVANIPFPHQADCTNQYIIVASRLIAQTGIFANYFTSSTCVCNLKLLIFKLISSIDILSISCEIALRWMPEDCTALMTSHRWFRFWLGTVRQQAITSTNIDQVLWRHMTSISLNGLNCNWFSWVSYTTITQTEFTLRLLFTFLRIVCS